MSSVAIDSPLAPFSNCGPYRAADFWVLPEEFRCELILGRFVVTPSPVYQHQAILAELWRRMENVADTTGGKVLVAPMDVTLFDHSILQPDLLYISPAKRAILRDRVESAPDLVIEILSPTTRRRDLGVKRLLYARAGVEEYWIIDGAARRIELLLLRGGEYEAQEERDGSLVSQAFPGLALDLADFWAGVGRRLA